MDDVERGEASTTTRGEGEGGGGDTCEWDDDEGGSQVVILSDTHESPPVALLRCCVTARWRRQTSSRSGNSNLISCYFKCGLEHEGRRRALLERDSGITLGKSVPLRSSFMDVYL